MKKIENDKYLMMPLVMKGKLIKNKVEKRNKFKLISLLLIILMILILFFGGYVLAKNIEEKLINSKTDLAEPILIIENNPEIDVTANNNYGEYKFKIKNFNELDKITEADLKYNIEILSDENFDNSVNFKLFENDKQINLNNKKSEDINMLKNNKEERIYKLEISYDKNATTSVNDIIQKIQIKVHAEQIRA